MAAAREAIRAADTIHRAFDDFHLRFRAITRRARQRFERCDWEGIRHDTVDRLALQSQAVAEVYGALVRNLGEEITDISLWPRLKEAYTHAILGRDDFELAQSYSSSSASITAISTTPLPGRVGRKRSARGSCSISFPIRTDGACEQRSPARTGRFGVESCATFCAVGG